ncbi:MAG: carboxymuconolactone decarboxylase [Gammaproteobacteria bacterium]|nr:MAG: carboxymuconolactone decarboxylase [Gammaproteobacteria bacterium]
MSDALSYLVKARPEAMTSYFSFLKKAGEHLDPKTRDIISVITKVAVQTEGGFKQYLTRALRNGVTPNEIIDGLLMAFPVLGLAKIVWASEILQEMDIPEFRPENLNAKPEWHDVATLDDVPVNQTSFFEVKDRHVYVFRTEEDIRIYDSRCPHQVTDIPLLALDEKRLTCPKHEWAFNIETGECVANGKYPLRRFESKIENGRLLAYW